MCICFIPSLHKIEGSFIRDNHQVPMSRFGDDFLGKNDPKYIIRKLFSSVFCLFTFCNPFSMITFCNNPFCNPFSNAFSYI